MSRTKLPPSFYQLLTSKETRDKLQLAAMPNFETRERLRLSRKKRIKKFGKSKKHA